VNEFLLHCCLRFTVSSAGMSDGASGWCHAANISAFELQVVFLITCFTHELVIKEMTILGLVS